MPASFGPPMATSERLYSAHLRCIDHRSTYTPIIASVILDTVVHYLMHYSDPGTKREWQKVKVCYTRMKQ